MSNIITLNEALSSIDKIKTILENDGVIAVPTDTIYGLAALVRNERAIKRIYEIKGRSFLKPLAISVGTVNDISKWSVPTISNEHLNELLPGPVTLMFPRQTTLPDYFNPSVQNVAVRIPDYTFMIELAQRLNEPIALTSANISDSISSLTIDEFESLWPKIDLIIDGGLLTKDRTGSTIVDLSVKQQYHIQRYGVDNERIIKYLKNDCHLTERK
ncbi:unnamed protein product [Didymodactylos carnosus]|uniref:Threonylcarbamoyl-AMP synthase n=1 Tax=Didymodactylos carnosus TaxID=1234261 RepID=A0A813S5M2_9BILA|nr:unnamed protein product [Didymodactylos carnosus]CAF0799854.1 unnamed protein product [Didymodactylos carnosus]CAF3574717.1 unnamed protein product [Didymodactylos carnosus]CAF3583128.1 unnamed protein product [Didymodactylos carnosus]